MLVFAVVSKVEPISVLVQVRIVAVSSVGETYALNFIMYTEVS